MPQPVLLRKISTIATIIRKCENWRSILAAKMGLSREREVRLRNGLIIQVDQTLRKEWGEVFEPAVADTYGIARSDADLIVDIGCNIGAFSCLAAKTHPQAHIYAFEPNPAAIQQARLNFRRNGLINVQLTESLVTADGRKVTLHIGNNRGSVSIVLMGEGRKVEMPSVTLDGVPFRKAKSVFFKIDCEGAEGEIIPWIIAHRDRMPPRVTLACEHHVWCPRPADDLVGALREAGFEASSGIEYGSRYIRASCGRQLDAHA